MTHHESQPDSNRRPSEAELPADSIAADGYVLSQTPATDQLAQACDSLTSLLKLAGVEQVICIDDDFAIDHEDNLPSELLGSIEDEKPASLGDEWKILYELPADIRAEKFDVIWRQAKSPARKELRLHLERLAAANGTIDLGARKLANLLESIKVCAVHRLTFRDWQSRQASLLSTKFDGKFTLLLIDQDFSKEGGSGRGGIEILRTIQTALTDEDAASIRCALLTNTNQPGEEHKSWDQFATAEDLSRSRFMLISKARLSDEEFGGFVLMTRLTVLNPLCETLRIHAARVYSRALEEAAKQLDGVTIYDFERIVFASSRKEGVWEPDTLFRILGLFLRREARRLAADDSLLRTIADKVRGLAGPNISDPKSEGTNARVLRRLELYEDGPYLNKHHTPIDLGDVFEVVKMSGDKVSRRRYLLVAQPCEMMVRVEPSPGGRRRANAIEGVLVEIVGEKPRGSSYQLDYFEPTGEHAHAVFGKARVANLNILDLCVFRQDGHAEIASSDAPADGLIPSWRARHRIVLKHLADCLKAYERLKGTLAPLNPQERDRVKKQAVLAAELAFMRHCVAENFGPNPIFNPVLSLEPGGGRIKFSCQRIRRLTQPWSGALLTEYSHNLSRAAFEHDFGGVDADMEHQT